MKHLSDLIAWGIGRKDIDQKRYKEIAAMPILDILKLFDDVIGDEGGIKDFPKYNLIKAVIADKLELPQRDIIVPFISDLFTDLSDRIDDLDKNFKNHRHDASKSYTEKPSW